jgi:hypothetical protein
MMRIKKAFQEQGFGKKTKTPFGLGRKCFKNQKVQIEIKFKDWD